MVKVGGRRKKREKEKKREREAKKEVRERDVMSQMTLWATNGGNPAPLVQI